MVTCIFWFWKFPCTFLTTSRVRKLGNPRQSELVLSLYLSYEKFQLIFFFTQRRLRNYKFHQNESHLIQPLSPSTILYVGCGLKKRLAPSLLLMKMYWWKMMKCLSHQGKSLWDGVCWVALWTQPQRFRPTLNWRKIV